MQRHLAAIQDLLAVAQQAEDESTPIEVMRGRRICGVDDFNAPLEPCFTIYDVTGNELVARFAGQVIPPTLRIIIVLLLASAFSWFLRRAISRFTRGLKQKAVEKVAARQGGNGSGVSTRVTARTDTIGGVLRSVATVVVWGMAVLAILGEIGIDLAPLLAGAGVAGLALGFGAQRMVQDFLSGLFMIIEDQYGIGDIVDVGEATGTIEAVTLRTTRLRDVTGVLWHVPNGEIRRVGNMSQEWSRALLDIGVAYDSDIPKVKAILLAVAEELANDPDWSDHFHDVPAVWGVQDFGPNEVIIRMVIKVAPAQQWKIERELRERIKAAFDAADIEIPFPQRTLWIRQDEAGVAEPARVPEAKKAAKKSAKKATKSSAKKTAKRPPRKGS